MILHVFADTPHHYRGMSRFFLNHCNLKVEQRFIVKSSHQESEPCFETYQTAKELKDILSRQPNDSVIVFHGIFDVHVWKVLAFSPLLKRASCIFWGGELYRHQKPLSGIKERLARALHTVFIKRQKHVFALNKGDSTLAAKTFGRKVDVLPYPLIGVSAPKNTPEPECTKILIGNSAAASNNHDVILDHLAKWKDENIEVIAPLNYAGQADYVERIAKRGTEIFGDKFKAITTMLEKEEYDALLGDVHCTVFAQNRQQGLYVAYAMLLMGKPIFLLSGTSSYINLSDLGFNVEKTEALEDMTFDELFDVSHRVNHQNAQLMHQHFTEEALAPKWRKLISGQD